MANKLIPFVLAAAVFATIVYIGTLQEGDSVRPEPNPMKQNAEQFTRITPALYVDGSADR